MFKKVVTSVMIATLLVFSSFAATSGVLNVSGTIASNLSLELGSSSYTMLAAGVAEASPATVSTMTVKSNAKTSFTITVGSSNIANNSFNAKTTLGTGAGGVELWPYKLYLVDGAGSPVEFTSTTSWAQMFTRKTTAAGDSFTLKTSYASAESLNLDAGTYTDTITVVLTAN